MKKYLLLLLTFFALNSCQEDDTILDSTADKKMPKVDVCHYDTVTDTWKTISINGNALKAHLKHGDKEGACDDLYTYVPDDGFEEALILWGYDEGPLDDYVLTANINKVETLDFGEPCCVRPWADQGPDEDGPGDSGYPLGVRDFTGIEGFINLKSLIINRHKINVPLDLSKNVLLEQLDFENVVYKSDALRFFDLSKNVALKYIYIDTGGIQSLNLKNGTNTLITSFFVWGGPQLLCIQVDDEKWSNDNWDKEPDYIFSEDCSGVMDKTFVPDDAFERNLVVNGYDDAMDDWVLTANIENIEILSVNGLISNGTDDGGDFVLGNMIGIEAFKELKELSIYTGVLLRRIDLSKNVNLTKFSVAGSTPLFALDFSKNTQLRELTIGTFLESLTRLNLKNGNNEAITVIDTKHLPKLNCIQVDNVEYSTANWTNIDAHQYFSNDCGY